jgi:hypothetical protein
MVTASDACGRSYKIAGFEINELDRLLRDHPVLINPINATTYVKFMLPKLLLWDEVNDAFFISDVSDFIALNDQIRRDSLNSRHSGKEFANEADRIRRLLKSTYFTSMGYSIEDGYCVPIVVRWSPFYTGDLRLYRVLVTPDGHMEVQKDTLLGSDVGYWYNVH